MPWQHYPHRPKIRLGYSCPEPRVELPIDSLNGTVALPFLLDTGASVSLFPIPLARRKEIRYSPEPAPPRFRPRTMTGELDGHMGTLQSADYLGRPLDLPCFFYHPPAATDDTPVVPPRPAVGPRSRRTAAREPLSPDQWLAEMIERGPADDDPLDPAPCVLGRLGFLNRYHVLVLPTRTIVSAEPIVFPPPRPWWQRLVGG